MVKVQLNWQYVTPILEKFIGNRKIMNWLYQCINKVLKLIKIDGLKVLKLQLV